MGAACSMYGEKRNAYRLWLYNMKKRGYLKDPGADEWILKKKDGRKWSGFFWLRIEASGELL